MFDLRPKNKRESEELFVSTHPGHCFLITDSPEKLDRKILDFIFANQAFKTVPASTDMFDILVAIDAFKSKGEARRNWKWTNQQIEEGCHSFVVGRKNVSLFIFKPVVCINKHNDT